MSKRCGRGLAAFTALAIIFSSVCGDSAYAGGSWGSSRGGFGSGGGLFGGRQPIRSLLGAVGGGIGGAFRGAINGAANGLNAGGGSGGFGSGGSMGYASSGSRSGIFSHGGLLGLGIGPRLRGAMGSAGGHASTGGYVSTGGFGSTGGLVSTGGWGSSGSSFASTGGFASTISPTISPTYHTAPTYVQPSISYGSTGGLYSGGLYSHGLYSGGLYDDGLYSDSLYATSATGNYYGDWGMDYLSGSAPITLDSYDVHGYQDTGLEYGSIEDAYTTPSYNSPATIYDSSFMGGQDILQVAPMSVETDYLAPVLDYGAISTGLPFDSGNQMNSLLNETMVSPGAGSTFGPINSQPTFNGGSEFGDGLPDAPSPDSDMEDDGSTDNSTRKRNVELASSRKTKLGRHEAVLSIVVPEDAAIYINGKLTKTKGTKREYVSRNLKKDKAYRYQIKAVVKRGGKEIVRSKMVRMRPGNNTVVKLNFKKPTVTTLVLKVPRDARVLLDGQETKAQGNVRRFSTQKLTEEQAWNGYRVEVSYSVGDKTVVRKQQVNLIAGSTKVVEFGGEMADRLASK